MRAYLLITGIVFVLMAALHVYLTYDHLFRPGGDLANAAGPACVFLISASLAIWAFRLMRRVRPGE